ncbi:MAG: cation:proton antiporter [Verrucomicrobiota bacterium JB022]|nr:cation:proton antiporter [Verrucomicrobiota bacterium JB022]
MLDVTSPLLAAGQIGEGLSHTMMLTLSTAIAAGGLLMALAKRLRLPGIVLLLYGGITLGPEGWGIVQPNSLGPILNVLVSLAVGLILFEGGLTLNVAGYKTAPQIIRNLLTIGVLTTWLLTSGVIWLVTGCEPTFALLAGTLVTVTGPTVISPILKRIRLKWNLHHILHWEGVLIDPVGVFLAVLAYEWVVVGGGEVAMINLLLRIVGGLGIGFIAGQLICWLLKRRFIPEDMVNVFMLSSAVATFGVTDALISEGGLLSVTVAGLIVGSRQPPGLEPIIEFKSVIVDLLIGFVFILLTARLDLDQFANFGWQGFLVVGAVVALIRPASILLSSWNQGLDWREKTFLSWVAPRGVVAASMASLFTLSLSEQGRFANPEFIETFVYSVIVVTVVLQGFSAGPLAAILRLQEKPRMGWLIIGAHPLARSVAKFLRDRRQVPVALIDGNRRAVGEAQAEGLVALFADARDVSNLEEREELRGIGRLLAFTDNEDLNELLCQKWAGAFGKTHVYRWSSNVQKEEAIGTVLWSWMPKPSMISSEVMLGEAAIVELTGERLRTPGNLSALMTANPREVLLDPGPETRLKADRNVEPVTLYLQREADHLLQALRAELVLRVKAETRNELLEELVTHLAGQFPALSISRTLTEIQERENAAPTLIGHGIALPHAHISGLDETIAVLAQIPGGMTYYPGETEPVRLVFLLLSPPEQPEMHLAVLSEIARLCSDAQVRQELMECEDQEEILIIVRRHRRQHTPYADVRG